MDARAPTLTSMEPIHILFLIDVLYSTHGGAEGILWKMTQLLPPDRYRCSIATFAADTDRVVAGSFNCPVHLFPIQRIYDWNALKTAFRLARLIRAEHVSIAHTFFPASDLFGGLIARVSGCPIVVSSRRDMGFQRSAIHRVAYRLAAGGLFDQVHAVGDGVRLRHIQQDRLDPEKVVTVHNGVDLDEIDRLRKRRCPSDFAAERATPVIICVANIRPVKALDVLVRTAAIVCREVSRARFLVVGAVGDAGYMQQVREIARSLNVSENVTFMGASAEVPSLLDASDIFYLPSRSEGLSNAMLEAMACALPCVATDVGGNRELVEDGRTGYLVPADDPEAAAQKILILLRDRQLATRMGRVGRRVVEFRFSVQEMISRLTELYDGLLRGLGDRQDAIAGEPGIYSQPSGYPLPSAAGCRPGQRGSHR